MKILVTGGAGRLGSTVVSSLVQRGHNVTVFDLPQVNYSRVSHLPRVQISKGDITNLEQLKVACDGVDITLHLAAILPPYSERSPERTLHVNATGTECLVKALELTSSAPLVLSSSVTVYGQTQGEKSPITSDHPLMPTDHYSKSKIMAEEAVRSGGVRSTILRISGVYTAIPFEFPTPVQFQAKQRVEFVERDDVVTALLAAVESEVTGKVLNIAGGTSWRMTGEHFVAEVFDAFGFLGTVDYQSNDGYFDWYDTETSQRLLGYQLTPFSLFKEKLAKAFSAIS
jgi:nucleoside-diphosphate-sugar epimerase